MQRILVVEDEFSLRELLDEIMCDEGYAVLTAVDGVQAVKVARTESPDLILMDLMIPVLDGVEALRILKADRDTRAIPIIAMSAGWTLSDSDRLLADGFLVKPFDIHTLLEEVASCLRLHADLEPFHVVWD